FDRRLPDQAAERSRQMRLIEIAAPLDDVEDRQALAQQMCRVASAFHRSESGVRDAGGAQHMALHGTERHVLRLTPQRGLDGSITHKNSFFAPGAPRTCRRSRNPEIPRPIRSTRTSASLPRAA